MGAFSLNKTQRKTLTQQIFQTIKRIECLDKNGRNWAECIGDFDECNRCFEKQVCELIPCSKQAYSNDDLECIAIQRNIYLELRELTDLLEDPLPPVRKKLTDEDIIALKEEVELYHAFGFSYAETCDKMGLSKRQLYCRFGWGNMDFSEHCNQADYELQTQLNLFDIIAEEYADKDKECD
jgi:hypothetical protein